MIDGTKVFALSRRWTLSDFYNIGPITTLHRLGAPALESIESELKLYSLVSPATLVLPALYSDVMSDAMKIIKRELMEVRYIKEVVLVLAPATSDEFKRTKEFLSELPQDVSVIHTSGDGVQSILEDLETAGVAAGEDGKGRSAWLGYGYVIARGESDVIALHDCDVLTYSREMLARLCYPVMNPALDYVFCKGFYARATDKLHGRVSRLFVMPVVNALRKIIGPQPFLDFIASFRYPLAGEFCMITDMARINRIPWDWGLEVGVLAEVYRNYSARSVCQVDLAENYEHKHQELSPDDATKGLMKMSVEIGKSLFRTLAGEGVVFSEGFFKTLVIAYQREAQDTIMRYEADAAINCLNFDRHEEAMAVEAFTRGIDKAADIIRENPLGAPLIPNWNRVISAVPGVLERLSKVVKDENG